MDVYRFLEEFSTQFVFLQTTIMMVIMMVIIIFMIRPDYWPAGGELTGLEVSSLIN